MTEYNVTVVWDDGANVKTGANTGGSALKTFAKGQSFIADALVPDSLDPMNALKKWARIAPGQDFAGKHVAVWYPSSARGHIRATWEEIGDEPEPTPTPEVIYPAALKITPLDENNNPIGAEKIYKA
jgi:hypothetical protein